MNAKVWSEQLEDFRSTTRSNSYRGNSSVGRASACHAEGREFESRFPLKTLLGAYAFSGL